MVTSTSDKQSTPKNSVSKKASGTKKSRLTAAKKPAGAQKTLPTPSQNQISYQNFIQEQPMIQLLDDKGQLYYNEQFSPYIENLDEKVLKDLYKDMVFARAMDEEATIIQRQGNLALWVPLKGQEAAQVGSAHALQNQDFVFPSYREHAVGLVRGVDMRELFKVFTGNSHKGWNPQEHNFHIYTLVLATQVLHAVGYAMGIQKDEQALLDDGGKIENPEVVMTYFGDGASSEGDIHESMVFASSQQSPIVFFLQNNQWAISVPVQTQSRVALANRAQGYGMPGVQIDGNDVLASYAVSQWALDHAREGHGPSLIEAFTYRRNAHTTADDPTKYRTSEEENQWEEKDPIDRYKKYLETRLDNPETFFDKVDQEAAEFISTLRGYIENIESPDPLTIFDHVYSRDHSLVDQEREEFIAFENSFESENTHE